MKIDDYRRIGYFDSLENVSMDRRGYENLKRQGRVKITSVDGKNMNVFFMYGESADGDIKIYRDKNNGNITIRGKKEVDSEDINFFKEDLSKVMDRARKIKERSIEESSLVQEEKLGFILLEDGEMELEEVDSLEDEHLFKGIIFDPSRIESDDRLEEYFELKDLIDKARKKELDLPTIESGIKFSQEDLIQQGAKPKDMDMAQDLFELIRARIYEDKLLISKIRDNRDKTTIYKLLK